MFSKFNKRIDTLFVDLNSENFNTVENVNIILSPALYWVRKISLPVKNAREARNLLPSLFEDILPEGIYSYSVYKEGEDFFIFAYEDKKILELLHTKGISSMQLENVYFSQSELIDLQNAKKISDAQSIYVKDDIVLLIPSQWTEDALILDIDGINLSKHSIRLKQFGHIVDDKSFNTLVVIFSILIMLLGMEYFITQKKLQDTLSLRDDAFVNYGLKSTMLQNRSMLKSYNKIHDKQTKLREYIGYFLSMKLRSGERLSLVKLHSNTLRIEISGIKNNMQKTIINSLKKKEIIFNPSFKNDTLSVEIVL